MRIASGPAAFEFGPIAVTWSKRTSDWLFHAKGSLQRTLSVVPLRDGARVELERTAVPNPPLNIGGAARCAQGCDTVSQAAQRFGDRSVAGIEDSW